MKKPTDKIIPMRIPVRLGQQLHKDINALADVTGYSSQDIMRLALRIGLTELSSVGPDLAKLVKQSAEELGTSFQTFAETQTATAELKPRQEVRYTAGRRVAKLDTSLNEIHKEP